MRVNHEMIGSGIRVAFLLSTLCCACSCGGRAAANSEQQTCLVQDDCEPGLCCAAGACVDGSGAACVAETGTDAASGTTTIDAGASPVVLEPDCIDSGTCAGAGRCVEGICAPSCTDLPDLVIPEGEYRYLQGTAAYCNVIIAGTLQVQSYDGAAGGRLELNAVERVVVLASGRIVADGCGYPSGSGPGAGGCTAGGSDGGGYGGEGGPGCCPNPTRASSIGPTYGQPSTRDIELGSGGGVGRGCSEGLGGSGGGAIALVARSMTVAGELSADGTPEQRPSKWSPGAGSGGGILLIATDAIDFMGKAHARGGTPSPATWGGGGGGGGRVKLFAPKLKVAGAIDVAGGAGGEGNWQGSPGRTGSIYTGI